MPDALEAIGDFHAVVDTLDGPAAAHLVESLRVALGAESDVVLDDLSVDVSGDELGSRIREAIRSSSTVIVLDSDASRGSSWVRYEVSLAQALGTPVVLVRSGPSSGGDGAPMTAGLPVVAYGQWGQLRRFIENASSEPVGTKTSEKS